MVKIKAFKGITYNSTKIRSLDTVMSPPYDIISESMQETLYNNSPYNFVRLILGKQKPSDNQNDNRYTRSKEFYEQWLQEKILVQSDTPALFPYEISYESSGLQKTMSGFFTLLKLDPSYKSVKAHERTLSKPKADRLDLMRATHSNLEPIQLLYIDQEGAIQSLINQAQTKPIISVTGYDGFTHTLFKLTKKSVIESIVEKLSDQNLFIADGHHRYQTAINYAEEMKKKTKNDDPDAPFNYQMVILVNMFDKGLDILPTHRLIKMPQLNRDDFLDKLQKYFTIESQPVIKSEHNESYAHTLVQSISTETKHAFIMYFSDMYYILRLKNIAAMDSLASDHSKTWRTLDVSILHKIILESIMGINESNIEDHVKYTREDSEALSKVDSGEFTCSFLMNPTKIDELKAIADGGEHMPQKSTYFLPKMLSGLVMYKM